MPRTAALSDIDPPAALVGAALALPAVAAAMGPDAAWAPLAGGRVNRLWRAGAAVVKLHDPAGASPLFPNDPADEAAALATLAPAGLAPVLLGTGPGWIAYRYLPGRSWTGGGADAAGPAEAASRPCDTPASAARLLGRLHAHPAAGLPFRHLPSGACALRAQGLRILAECRGRLPPPPDVADPGPVARPVPLHGDAVPGNMIAGADGLRLIDWQCPALGDPAEDLAAFLSPAMQGLYRGAPLTGDEARAVLDAYPDRRVVARHRALAPLFRWRMAAHCLWRAERGVPGYAQALERERGG